MSYGQLWKNRIFQLSSNYTLFTYIFLKRAKVTQATKFRRVLESFVMLKINPFNKLCSRNMSIFSICIQTTSES